MKELVHLQENKQVGISEYLEYLNDCQCSEPHQELSKGKMMRVILVVDT